LVVSVANPNEQKATGQPMLGFVCGSPPTCSQTAGRRRGALDAGDQRRPPVDKWRSDFRGWNTSPMSRAHNNVKTCFVADMRDTAAYDEVVFDDW